MIREAAAMMRKMAENLEGLSKFTLPEKDIGIREAIELLAVHVERFHVDLSVGVGVGRHSASWVVYLPDQKAYDKSTHRATTLKAAVEKAILTLREAAVNKEDDEAVTPSIDKVEDMVGALAPPF